MTSLSRAKKAARLGLAAVTLAASMMTLVTTADASPTKQKARDGYCDKGEFCLYWGVSQVGSLSDFDVSVANYGTDQPTCYDFKSGGAGQGQCIKNNAYSAWNRSTRTVRVYYNSNYGGVYQTIAPGESPDLNPSLRINNASHKFL